MNDTTELSTSDSTELNSETLPARAAEPSRAVTITDHADARLKQRLGLPKSARQTAAQRAFDNGKRHGEATGRLKRYLDKCWHTHRNANNVRLHAEHIWFFAGQNLITVYEIPKQLRAGI